MLDRLVSTIRGMSPGTQIAAVGGVALLIWILATDLRQALVIGLINGSMYGLVALGLVLIYKSSGIFNFAQGEFGTVAVYVMWLLLERNLPYVFCVLIALGTSIAMGLATERLIIRRLYTSPRVILLVATAGVALFFIGLEFWIGGPLLRTITPALSRTDRLTIFSVLISDQRMLLVLVLAGFGIGLAFFFTRTSIGLALLGAAQEPVATELAGISTKALALATWGMAAMLGGLAGVLNAPISGTFGPGFMTLSVLLPAFTAAILGGMNSLPGAFIGGAAVGVAESVALKSTIFASIPSPDTFIVFLILLGVLIARPQGILGKAT
jgi:branched-chain amino acid transport system permease protein